MNEHKSFLPGRLKYVIADATVPTAGSHRMIVHACSIDGDWTSEFMLALSKRWKKPEEEYKRWFRGQTNFKLGQIQEVAVQSDVSVINLLVMSCKELDPKYQIPVRYDALKACLKKLAASAKDSKSSVHMPRICCGFGQADWSMVEKIVLEELISAGINVTVYDLPSLKESVEINEK